MKSRRETVSLLVTAGLLVSLSLVRCSSPLAAPLVVPGPKPIGAAIEHPEVAASEEPEEALRYFPPTTPAEIRAEKVRREVIELRKRNALPADHWSHEWAGEYSVREGLGLTNITLSVAPVSGVAYTMYGCMGLYEHNYGSVVDVFDEDGDGKPDGLKVHWVEDKDGGYDYTSEHLYFVRWNGLQGRRGRRYLIPESKMMDFVKDYNRGSHDGGVMYTAPLMRQRTAERAREVGWIGEPVVGNPILSDRWAKLLLDRPLEATITKVRPPVTTAVAQGLDFTRVKLFLDKGKSSGVSPGMLFWVGGDADWGTVAIDIVNEDTAEGEFVSYTPSGEAAVIPKVGWSVRVAGHGAR